MVGLLAGVFRAIVEIMFWLIPIGCAVGGGVMGGSIGIFIGLIVGILVDVIYGGAVATLLVIEDSIAEMKTEIAKIRSYLKKNANAAGTADSFDVGTAAVAMRRQTTAYADDSFDVGAAAAAPRKTAVSKGGGSNRPAADEYGRMDYRTWWDSDGGKHESWIDADGNKHET